MYDPIISKYCRIIIEIYKDIRLGMFILENKQC